MQFSEFDSKNVIIGSITFDQENSKYFEVELTVEHYSHIF